MADLSESEKGEIIKNSSIALTEFIQKLAACDANTKDLIESQKKLPIPSDQVKYRMVVAIEFDGRPDDASVSFTTGHIGSHTFTDPKIATLEQAILMQDLAAEYIASFEKKNNAKFVQPQKRQRTMTPIEQVTALLLHQ